MPLIDTWRGPCKPQGARAFMGWDGLIVSDPAVDVLDMLRAYMRKAASESCGQCFPCRNGLKKLADALDLLCAGRPQDQERLRSLAALVADSSRCGIGRTAPRPLLDVLEQAPELLLPRNTPQGAYAAVVSAPCVSACPSHVDVPDYLEKIRVRRFAASLERVRRDCPLPGTIGRVCVRPCESACVRAGQGSPLAIRQLKRFVADEEARTLPVPAYRPVAAGAKKVAVIGAGPAGLACAWYLAHSGIAVTVLEAQPEPGGMARYGIPDYRLPPDVLRREVDLIRAAGCDIVCDVAVGGERGVEHLLRSGFDAVFVGTGAPESVAMRCAGEDACYEGFLSGIAYLAEAAKGGRPLSGTRAVVIGGGNVAMDCVRTLRRHGFSEVRLLYRRTREEMPADPLEIEEALEEGVIFTYLAAPLAVLAENNQVTGLRCRAMTLGAADASGRRVPEPVPDSDFILDCDVVIPAVGQKVAVHELLGGAGLTAWGTLDADPISGRVRGLENIFGGGDCVTGPSTLIAALAAGKRAAAHIAARLGGGAERSVDEARLEQLLAGLDLRECGETLPPGEPDPCLPVRALPPEQRIADFAEVEQGASAQEATREANRCLRCYRVALAAF